MRVAILSVSRNDKAISQLENQKDNLIPSAFRSKRYYDEKAATFEFAFFQYEDDCSEALRNRCRTLTMRNEAFILLLDSDDFADAEQELGEAAFCFKGDFGFRSFHEISLNAFKNTLVEALNDFSHLHRRMIDYKFQKALLLPGINFRSKPWSQLFQLLISSERPAAFEEISDRLLAQVRNTQKPKRIPKPPEDKKAFFVDDRDLYFIRGHEEHARPETKEPHNFRCGLNARWRFGVRYDKFAGEKHYNVSKDKKNSGITLDVIGCHGDCAKVSRNAHLNLFTNSYYT